MKLSVIQWNIWYKEKPANILKELQAHPADIYCLQEVAHHHHDIADVTEYFAKELEYHSYYGKAQYWPNENSPDTWEGNTILTKYPITNTDSVYVRETKHENFDDYSSEGRVIAIAEIVIKDTKYTVATTHLSYVNKFKETPTKLAEEEKLLAFIKNHSEKFILAGDFNVPPDSKLISALKKQLTHAGPDFSENTWTTKPFEYRGFKEDELNWRLDYIFSTPDISVNTSEIIETNVSDHLPVKAEFTLP